MTGSRKVPRFKRRAQVDLVEIWVYLAERSVSAADRILARLMERCDLLADSPGIGSVHPDIQETLRVFPCDSYVIVYRAVDDTIEIVRVVHGSRDWLTLLRDGE